MDIETQFNDLYPACVARWGEPTSQGTDQYARVIRWALGPGSEVRIVDDGASLFMTLNLQGSPRAPEWTLRKSKFRPRDEWPVEDVITAVESWLRDRGVTFPKKIEQNSI